MNFHRYLLILALAFSSCVSQKKLAYFQGSLPPLSADSIYQVRIFPGDILSVNIFTINTEAYPYLSIPNDRSLADNRSAYEKGYVVNARGDVKLPLAGTISVKGLTIPEATTAIENKFKEFILDPLVTVRKLNFKVTILGEVTKPGTYQIMNEKATLPEVLGLAGDLTQFGDRKALRIIREENSQRKDFTVDLTDARSLSAETYYLHPDDIIYIQPLKRRAFQNISPSVTLFTSIITTAVVVITLIITTSE